MLRERRSPRGLTRAPLSLRFAARRRAADMQETTEQPTLAPEAPDGLAAAALRAEAWAGEPFLHADEDPAVVLAPETARRRALDDALAEIEAGAREPSYEWKVRYGLMLGLERVLSQKPAAARLRHRAAPPPDRRARRDADRADRRDPGRGGAERQRQRRRERPRGGSPRRTRRTSASTSRSRATSSSLPEEHHGKDPGAVRRYRFRHPTASGKTIAAAGLRRGRAHARRPDPHAPPAARLAVQPRADGRGLRRPLRGRDPQGQEAEAARTRSRSRPTPGSRATSATSTARRTSS